VRELDVDILAGNPFLDRNDIAVRVATREITIGGSDTFTYSREASKSASSIRRTQATVLRSPCQTVVLPGEYLELETPEDLDPDSEWLLEPRSDTAVNSKQKPERAWPEHQEILSVGNTLRVVNSSTEPILLRRNEHFCQIRKSDTPSTPTHQDTALDSGLTPAQKPSQPFSSGVSVDPDKLTSPAIRQQFHNINLQYDDIFNLTIPKYNGASGKIQAVVNNYPSRTRMSSSNST
jgi:hypothetical protein